MPSENRSQVDLGHCTNLTGMGETWLHFNLHCVDNFFYLFISPPTPLKWKPGWPWLWVCALSLWNYPVENQRPCYKSVLPMLGHYCTSVQVTAAVIQGRFRPRFLQGPLWQAGIQTGLWIFLVTTDSILILKSHSLFQKLILVWKNWHNGER